MLAVRNTKWGLFKMACACLAATAAGIKASAHEGHAPLPTKGAQVDVAEGLLTLSADARKSLGVQTSEMVLQPIRKSVMAYATIDLDWQQHRFVTTPIAGRIARLYVKPGELVVRDQRLADIESTELANLQLELLEAQNRAELSAGTLARVEQLAKVQAIPGRDVAEAAATHRENEAAVEIGKSKLRRLRLSDAEIDRLLRAKEPIRSLPILSPMAGVAIHTDLALGQVVEPTEHLFEIMDLSSVAVRIDVLERDLGTVQVGQAVELSVTAFPGVVFQGKVFAKEPFIEAQTHLGRVWATLTNNSHRSRQLLPGMYGQADILVSSPEKKLVAPKQALLTNGTESFVLVEEAATSRGSEYRKRNVAIGMSDASVAEITAGDVFPGDQVVTTGGHELTNFFIQGVLRLSPEARKNLGVIVKPATVEYVDEVVEVDAAIELPPEQRAVAASPLAGAIERILVNRGQAVRAGEVVAELSSQELLETQYELLQADVQLQLIDETLGRLRQFKDSQIIAGKRLLELESQAKEVRFRRDIARQRLHTLGLTTEQISTLLTDKQLVESLPIRAPIDGVIVRFDKSLGQVIAADQPLFEIHDLSNILVRAHLGERDSANAPVGATARVRVAADPNFLAEGKVVRSGSTFGDENRTASAWIELTGEQVGTLYHDMLARVTLAVEQNEPMLAVPIGSVIREGMRSFVFVEDGTGLLTRRAVKTGRADDRWVEIVAGLKPGEGVAVQGAGNLQTAHASLR
jgi:RND family efflux transporter MFP subunit